MYRKNLGIQMIFKASPPLKWVITVAERLIEWPESLSIHRNLAVQLDDCILGAYALDRALAIFILSLQDKH